MSFQRILHTTRKSSHFVYESLVIRLIETHLGTQGKSLVLDPTGSRYIDALAPEGIDDLPKPTMIEIKGEMPLRYLLRAAERLFDYKSYYNAQSALLVTKGLVDEEKQSRIIEHIKKVGDLEIVIWDVRKLEELFEQYKDEFDLEYTDSEIVQSLRKARYTGAIRRSQKREPETWRKKKVEYIKQLKEKFSKDEIVLFLGAGVSMDAGLPGWNELLSELRFIMVERNISGMKSESKEKIEIAKALSNLQESTPLISAQYIKTALGAEDFRESVREVMYRNINKSYPILEAIAKFCIPRRGKVGVRAVVTYNFDELLEEELERRDIDYRMICRDTDRASEEEIPIYHVHGFLPKKKKPIDEYTDVPLVLYEERYHTLFGAPYHWANHVQVNFLRENTCLFIGLSMTDPNLRRLLRIAARSDDKPRHYVSLKQAQLSDFKANKRSLRGKRIQSFLNAHNSIQETAFEELGGNIIWLEKHREITKILTKIRSRGAS